MKRCFLITGFAMLTACPAWAYFSTFTTAQSLEKNQYEAAAEFQYILNRIAGANFIGHFNMGLGKGGEAQFLVGTGSTNFQVGGYYKTNPIPDLKNQPAMSILFGSIYANKDGAYSWSFRAIPLVSKKFEMDEKSFITPYLALPLGATLSSGTTTFPIHLVFGAEWLPSFFTNLRIVAEAGFEMNAAFSYYTAGLKLPFDDTKEVRLE